MGIGRYGSFTRCVVAILLTLWLLSWTGTTSALPDDPETGPGSERALAAELAQASRQKNLTKIQTIYALARLRGFHRVARKAAESALMLDVNLEWANLAVGNRNLQEIFDRIPEDDLLDAYGNEEYETLVEEREYADSWWVTKEQFEELSRLLDATLSHHHKLKSDPRYLDEYVIRLNVARDPVYHRYPCQVLRRGPYIMFVEVGADGEIPAETEKIVERNLTLLSTLYTQFMADFKGPFELPEISELEQPYGRNLRLWTFSSRVSFLQYQRDIRMPLPPGVGAYYRPNNQWITLFEPPGSQSRYPAFNTNKVVHEGFHQLMHALTRVVLERETGEEVLWRDRRTHSRLHWFQEGMAEFYGSAKAAEDGAFELKVPYRMRLREWFETRKRKRSDWAFVELLSIRNGAELMQRSRRKGLTQQGRLASLFYAQAWTWVYFLHNFEDGKYRDKLIEYMGKELKGISGPDEFAKTWGAGDSYDWGPIEKEWRGYVDKLWADQGFK